MDTITQRFFAALTHGGPDAALALVDPDAEFIAVRPDGDPRNPLYGTYRGHDGVRRFIGLLGDTFETELFAIDAVAANGEEELARGRLRHKVRATGRLFACDWALACRVRGGRLVRYQFFEDTAALEQALRP